MGLKNQWMPQPRPPVRLCSLDPNWPIEPPPGIDGFQPELLHLPCDYPSHPALTSLLARWLRNLQPKPCQTRSFRERWAARTASPDCLASLAAQVVRVLDIEPLKVHLGPREATLYAEVGLVEGQPISCAIPAWSPWRARSSAT